MRSTPLAISALLSSFEGGITASSWRGGKSSRQCPLLALGIFAACSLLDIHQASLPPTLESLSALADIYSPLSNILLSWMPATYGRAAQSKAVSRSSTVQPQAFAALSQKNVANKKTKWFAASFRSQCLMLRPTVTRRGITILPKDPVVRAVPPMGGIIPSALSRP